MILLAVAVFIIDLALALSFIWGAVLFVRRLRGTPPVFPKHSNGKVLIITCLKGEDPFLLNSLQNLAAQDYPNFAMRLVVDSPNDPAWRTVHEFLESQPPVSVEVLTLRDVLTTCTRKMSSVLLGTSEIPPDVDYIMLADTDMVGPSDVLRRLVDPLAADPHIAVTSGNRWYNPRCPNIASVMRYQWNSFCVTMMTRLNLFWGGCCVMRANDWQDDAMRQEIAHCFCEDQRLADWLPRHKGRVMLVPRLLVVNQETCTLPQLFNFIERQLLAVRIQNSGWRFMQLHFYGGLFVLAASALCWQNPETRLWITSGLALLSATCIARVPYLEQQVQRALGPTRIKPQVWSWWRIMLPTLLCMGLVHALATISNLLMRTHVWRGVRYEVKPGPYVRMLGAAVIPATPAPLRSETNPGDYRQASPSGKR